MGLVSFDAKDTSLTRAKKIWSMMGIADSARFGFVERLATYLQVYKDLEEEHAKAKDEKEKQQDS